MEGGAWWTTVHKVAKKLGTSEVTEHVCIHLQYLRQCDTDQDMDT